ncbi:MAG TPA: hypothetical protein PKU80_09155 [Candidatus Limiplasma sp.]|nr:hypothetical protein [Candidatus Limiplasma sp.]HRX09245.1 hypothetical protein [Candidatus Limiplasma sp.]
MKKILSGLVVLALLIAMISMVSVGLAEDTAVKTGFGVVSGFNGTKNATADADGVVQVYPMYAAVTVDMDGKIVKCVIDSYQGKVTFDANGKITSDVTAPIVSKNVKGDAYGMKASSGIGKEWYEQAAAFADYCVGLTAEEVAAIPMDETGHASGEDVRAGATVTVSSMIKAVVAAVENAQDLGAMSSDSLGLASEVELASRSKDATADADGTGYAYAYYAAATFDADGKITSVVLDASQFSAKFNNKGEITTDIAAPQYAKQTLKDEYGMKAKSGIGKEWYEQANYFAAYVKGMTAEEVAGMAVDESGYAADADVLAGTTVHIGDFLNVIVAAYESVK